LRDGVDFYDTRLVQRVGEKKIAIASLGRNE
jgi:hypothetical protein